MLFGLSRKVRSDRKNSTHSIAPTSVISRIYSYWKEVKGKVRARQMKMAKGNHNQESRF